MRGASLALALAIFGCRREPEPLGPYTAFVPAVVRSDLAGRIPWTTRIELTNAAAVPAEIRVCRWPPDAPENEVQSVPLPAGGTTLVSPHVPDQPKVSSFWLESRTPFALRVRVQRRGGGGPPPLEVPILKGSDLARPGDRLLVGPFVENETERSRLCFTFPWTERDAVPFRVRLVFADTEGHVLGEATYVIPGVPSCVEHPWKQYSLPTHKTFNLEATFLGSAREREPRVGMWVYGITQDGATNGSRFLTTTVVHALPRSPPE